MPYHGDPATYEALFRQGITPDTIQSELASADDKVLFVRLNYLWYWSEKYDQKGDEANTDRCLEVMGEVETTLRERHRRHIDDIILSLIDTGDLPPELSDLTGPAVDVRINQSLTRYPPDSPEPFPQFLARDLTNKVGETIRELASLDVDTGVVLDPIRSREEQADALVAEALESLTPYQRVISCLTNGWKKQLKEEWIQSNRWEDSLKEFVRAWDGRPMISTQLAPYLKDSADNPRSVETKMASIRSTHNEAQLKLAKWVRARHKGTLVTPEKAFSAFLASFGTDKEKRNQAIRALILEGCKTNLQRFMLCAIADGLLPIDDPIWREVADLDWLNDLQEGGEAAKARFADWKAGRTRLQNLTDIGERMGLGTTRQHAVIAASDHKRKMFSRVLSYIDARRGQEIVSTRDRSRDAARDEFFRQLHETNQLKPLLESEALTPQQKAIVCFLLGRRQLLEELGGWSWIDSSLQANFADWEEGKSLTRTEIAARIGVSQRRVSGLGDEIFDISQDWNDLRLGKTIIDPKDAIEQLAAQTDREEQFKKLIARMGNRERQVFCLRYNFPEGLTDEDKKIQALMDWYSDPGRQAVNSPTKIGEMTGMQRVGVHQHTKNYLRKINKVVNGRRC